MAVPTGPQKIWCAPTIALPIVEVTPGYGDGTNYPFGQFDLATVEGRAAFDLYSLLAARVKQWNVAVSLSYRRRRDLSFAPPDFDDVSASHVGNHPMVSSAYSYGAADVMLADVESNVGGPVVSYWSNPHRADLYSGRFNADLLAMASGGGYDERIFTMNDVRLVSGAGGTTAITAHTGDLTTDSGSFPGFYDTGAGGSCLYNETLPEDLGATFGPFYTHSFRSRRYGYVGFQYLGSLTLYPTGSGVPAGAGLGFAYSTHIPTLKNTPGSPTPQGPIGTLTIEWPHPITNATVSVSCALYGIPTLTTETVLDLGANITITPVDCYSYDGIFNADGSTNRNPLGCGLPT